MVIMMKALRQKLFKKMGKVCKNRSKNGHVENVIRIVSPVLQDQELRSAHRVAQEKSLN